MAATTTATAATNAAKPTMISRRHFLSLIGAAPLVARTYFDFGPAWQRHASGLVVPTHASWVEIVTGDGRRLRFAAQLDSYEIDRDGRVWGLAPTADDDGGLVTRFHHEW